MGLGFPVAQGFIPGRARQGSILTMPAVPARWSARGLGHRAINEPSLVNEAEATGVQRKLHNETYYGI